MAEEFGRRYGAGTQTTTVQVDQGLRSHMLKVYNYMASGVLLTGILALVTANSPELFSVLYAYDAAAGTLSPTVLGFIVMFSPLAIVLVMSFGANRLSVPALQACFWGFAALMGLSLSNIFMVYTNTSIAQIFFVTAGAFASLSLWGYTTKRNLSGWGSFLFMGLIGIILASVVNIFLGSAMMDFVISVIGVLIFAGLTAYDTQKIKDLYLQGHGREATAKLSIMGALSLYLDFINMFLFLLRLFGNRE